MNRLSLAALAILLSAATPSPVRPGQVRVQLAAIGPSRTVETLAAGGGRDWQVVLTGLAHAQPEWLALAPQLAAGADAGRSEALHAALSDGLAVAPERVLPLAPATITLDRLCSVPLIEPAPAEVARYRSARLATLRRVRAPGLRAQAATCRRLLMR